VILVVPIFNSGVDFDIFVLRELIIKAIGLNEVAILTSQKRGMLLGMLIFISKVDFYPFVSIIMLLRSSFWNIFNFEHPPPPPHSKKRVLLLVPIFNFGVDFRVFVGNITSFLNKLLQKS